MDRRLCDRPASTVFLREGKIFELKFMSRPSDLSKRSSNSLWMDTTAQAVSFVSLRLNWRLGLGRVRPAASLLKGMLYLMLMESSFPNSADVTAPWVVAGMPLSNVGMARPLALLCWTSSLSSFGEFDAMLTTSLLSFNFF